MSLLDKPTITIKLQRSISCDSLALLVAYF